MALYLSRLSGKPFISDTDPTSNSNLPTNYIGRLYFNVNTGLVYRLIDNTTDVNKWEVMGDGQIKMTPSDNSGYFNSKIDTNYFEINSNIFTIKEDAIAKTDLSNVEDSTILNKLKNVDGNNSGLDADKLDGLDSSQFVRSDTDSTVDGNFHVTQNENIDHDLHVGGNVNIDGNLTVLGTTTTVNAENMNVSDNIIILNEGETGSGVSQGIAGIEIDRGTLAYAKMIFDESDDRWKVDFGDGQLRYIITSLNENRVPNADKLDGLDSTQFLRSDVNDEFNGVLSTTKDGERIVFKPATSGGWTGIRFDSRVNSGSDKGYIRWYDDNNNYNFWGDSNENGTLLIGVENDGQGSSSDVVVLKSPAGVIIDAPNLYVNGNNKVWHSGNDGSGSGLDADKLDGLDSSQFVRSDTSDSLNGTYNLTNTTLLWSRDSDNAKIYLGDYGSNQDWLTFEFGDDAGQDRIRFKWNGGDGNYSIVDFLSNQVIFYKQPYVNGNKIWHSGNDGSNSGLDADKLDGYHASYFAFSTLSNVSNTVIRDKLKAVDGSGSGIDADLLDGHDSSYFSPSTHNHDGRYVKKTGDTITGDLTIYKDNPYIHFNDNSDSSVDVSIGVEDENFYIRETEDNNREWFKISDDDNAYVFGNKIWHQGNDGSGSGLDADLLDGHDSSYFANNSLSNVNNNVIRDKLKAVDGSGSGIDADLLDGHDSSYFERKIVDQAISSNITASSYHRYLVDTSNGGVTVTLPVSPSNFDKIYFLDLKGTFNINPLVIARNGKNIMGEAEDMEVTSVNSTFGLIYYDGDWRVI